MKDNKGFVMTETLVVTVFLVTIFTFIYVSIIPLMGKYEDMISREKDIEILYKLYHIRKMIFSDPNRESITNTSGDTYKPITCSLFSNPSYCNKMMEYLDLNDYLLVYVDDIYESMNSDPNVGDLSKEIYDYVSKYQLSVGKTLILLNNTNHTIAHLKYDDYT